MLKHFANIILRLWGWKTEYKAPGVDKYVIIGAPHTTNWDFPLALLALVSMGVNFNWVGKHTLFRWPFGTFFRAIGGIPVDRSTGTGFLKNILEIYRIRHSFVLAMAPEGTRGVARYWKTGFYTIAVNAEIPILLGYIDYKKKMIGACRMLYASGDIDRDFAIIKDFYQDKQGKYPEKQGEIRIKSRKTL